MKPTKISFVSIWVLLFVCSLLSCRYENKSSSGTNSDTAKQDTLRREIEAADKQFALDFNNGDSVALAGHYASDGSLGSIKGKENLVKTWGTMIRNAAKEGNPVVNYITNALSTDGEFVTELGVYQYLDIEGNVKASGKYLVVWKKENDKWKLYKDMGL